MAFTTLTGQVRQMKCIIDLSEVMYWDSIGDVKFDLDLEVKVTVDHDEL